MSIATKTVFILRKLWHGIIKRSFSAGKSITIAIFNERETMKAIVIYYSLTGKTELVATTVAKVLGAEVKRIEEIKPRKLPSVYFFGGLTAMTNKSSRIKPLDFNVDNYDLILVGSPVWAGKPTPAVNTFIAKTDFKSKDVVVFCTAGGDMKGTEATFKNLTAKVAKKSGKVIGSFAISTGKATDGEIVEKTREEARKYRERR
jgi:flavodoxin